MGMKRNIVTASPLQNAAAMLLGDAVTEDVTEIGPDMGMISVSDTATEIPEKRKRGRPAKAGVAMTGAERSRRYREKHRPAWRDRRVDLLPSTISIAGEVAAELGITQDDAIYQAIWFMIHECTELSDFRDARLKRIFSHMKEMKERSEARSQHEKGA